MISKVFKLHTRGLFNELNISFHHNVDVIKLLYFSNLRYQKNIKLHCGSGYNYKKGFVNIDILGDYDLFLDLRKPNPFLSNSVDYVYSEHFLEHLDRDESMFFLNESYRVLKPDGVMRIGIPDTEWVIHNFIKGHKSEWLNLIKKMNWEPKYNITPMDHLNFHFRQGGEHKYVYDFETLSLFLKNAHFKNIKKSKYTSSIDSWKFGTLFAEATKLTK